MCKLKDVSLIGFIPSYWYIFDTCVCGCVSQNIWIHNSCDLQKAKQRNFPFTSCSHIYISILFRQDIKERTHIFLTKASMISIYWDHHCALHQMGHVALVAITGTTVGVPYL